MEEGEGENERIGKKNETLHALFFSTHNSEGLPFTLQQNHYGVLILNKKD